MSLPDELCDCPAPASIRIEIYSAARGLMHGSLDGAAYSCPAHVAATIAAIRATGATTYRCADLVSRPARCGYVYAYVGGVR